MMWKWKIYLPHQYPQVEQWLADMAVQGWRLAEHRRFRFRFDRHEPRTRRFLYMYGGSRENDILSVVIAMKCRCHAQEIPGGRFTTATLLVLPAPDKAGDMAEFMPMRRREHVKYFLQWALAWAVFTLPLQHGVAVSGINVLLRWLGHAVLALPLLMNICAACMEGKEQ